MRFTGRQPLSILPPSLQAYEPILDIVLLFVDGLIIGVAVKKAITSIVLIIIGILLAGFVGLSIPFLSTAAIISHVEAIVSYQLAHTGPIFATFPIFWLIGIAIGIWRG